MSRLSQSQNVEISAYAVKSKTCKFTALSFVYFEKNVKTVFLSYKPVQFCKCFYNSLINTVSDKNFSQVIFTFSEMNRGLRLTLILSFLAYNVVELVLILKFPIIFELIIFLLHV